MRKFAIAIILLLLSSPAWAGFGYQVYGGGHQAADGECTLYHSSADSGEYNFYVGSSDVTTYGGQLVSDASGAQICKVAFELRTDTGDISTKVYKAFIFALNESNNFSFLLGVSDNGVSGSTLTTSYIYYEFTFAAAVTLSGGASNNYAIVVASVDGSDNGVFDESNYGRVRVQLAQIDSGYGNYGRWDSSGLVDNSNVNYDFHYKLYSVQ